MTDSTTPVYIVIAAWNGRDDTLACLESLTQLSYPSYRIVLVDNGSTDGTEGLIRQAFPQVEVLRSPENLGFSGGYNLGIRHAIKQGAAWVLILNNDTRAAPDLLSQLMAVAGQPGVGAVGPKIYTMSDPKRVWSVGGNRSRWTAEVVATGNGETDRGQWRTPLERDFLTGCAVLLRREMLDDIGLFDDDTFSPAYYEDSDLCWRARAAGWRLIMAPAAHLWHRGVGSSGGAGSPRERYLMARNSVRFFRKHVRGWRWLIVVPYRLGSALRTTAMLLGNGQWPSVRAYWRGLRDGLVARVRLSQTTRE